MIDEENMEFLKQHMQGDNLKNWYAHYQLGLGYYQAEDYQHAGEELQESRKCAENPWALHALSCVYLLTDRKPEAASCMKKGLNMRMEDTPYLKEGFRILSLCGKYEEIINIYDNLNDDQKAVGKLQYYYILSLHKLGQYEKALELLEADGGLVMDDIREGEESLAQLWSDLYANVNGCKGKIPHVFNFKAEE